MIALLPCGTTRAQRERGDFPDSPLEGAGREIALDKAGEIVTLPTPSGCIFSQETPKGAGRMWRPLVLVLAILSLPGCQGTGGGKAATDPFFGRTRVEPPRTGASTQTPGSGLSTPTSGGGSWPNAAAGQGSAGGGVAINWPSGPQSGGTASQTTRARRIGHRPNRDRPALPPRRARKPAMALPPPMGRMAFPRTGGRFHYNPSAVGSGDQIAIPSAARTLNERVQDSITRSQSVTPVSRGSMPAAQGSSGPGQAFGGTGIGFGAPPTASISGSQSRAASGGSLPNSGFSDREKIVRVIEPSPGAGSGTQSFSPYPTNGSPSTTGPAGPSGSEKPVNIADLPEAGS